MRLRIFLDFHDFDISIKIQQFFVTILHFTKTGIGTFIPSKFAGLQAIHFSEHNKDPSDVRSTMKKYPFLGRRTPENISFLDNWKAKRGVNSYDHSMQCPISTNGPCLSERQNVTEGKASKTLQKARKLDPPFRQVIVHKIKGTVYYG